MTPTTLTVTPDNVAEVAKAVSLKRYGSLEIKPVGPLDSGLVASIFSYGGVGKTTLAATATDTELGTPGLIVNCFGNPHVVSSYSDRLHVAELTEFNKAHELIKDLEADPNCKYKTLIFDHCTAMLTKRQHELYGASADIDWKKHVATTADMLQVIFAALLLSKGRHKMNVIFLWQQATEERQVNGEAIFRAEIAANKALQEQFAGYVPFLGRLYYEDTAPPFNRMLDFTPNEKVHIAKIQRDPKNEMSKTIPLKIYKPSLAPIIEAVKGVKAFPADQYRKKLGD